MWLSENNRRENKKWGVWDMCVQWALGSVPLGSTASNMKHNGKKLLETHKGRECSETVHWFRVAEIWATQEDGTQLGMIELHEEVGEELCTLICYSYWRSEWGTSLPHKVQSSFCPTSDSDKSDWGPAWMLRVWIGTQLFPWFSTLESGTRLLIVWVFVNETRECFESR